MSHRLVPDVPQWTSHEPEGRGAKLVGYAAYLGVSKAWCYLCNSEHPWATPCAAQRAKLMPDMRDCRHCARPFVRSRSQVHYCSIECRMRSRKLRQSA